MIHEDDGGDETKIKIEFSNQESQQCTAVGTFSIQGTDDV
jgi:hypothetical protein